MKFIFAVLFLIAFIACVVQSRESKLVKTTRQILEMKKSQLDTIKSSMNEVQNLILADEYYPSKDRLPGFVESQRQVLEELTSTMKSVQYQVNILSKLCSEKKGPNCDGKDNVSSSNTESGVATSKKQQILNSLSNDMNSIKDAIKLLPSKVQSNPWKAVGTFADLEKMLDSYPTLEYQWGIKYNTYTVTPLIIQSWNKGVRVFPELSYSMGDDAANLICGKTIFTKDTLDAESQQGFFYQRYVDCSYKDLKYSNNHNVSAVTIYVRKF